MNKFRMQAIAAALLASAAFGAGAEDPAWTADARKVASAIPPKLLAIVSEEMAKSGPEGAIAVCREKAPELAKAASAESGWAIRRVSLKNRNPKAVPDAWERRVLEDFDRRAAGGESPATLEKAEVVVVDGKETYRYMKGLPVQPLCVTCHGPAEQLAPALKERLKALYPDDKGVGYSPGDIRGAITLKKPV